MRKLQTPDTTKAQMYSFAAAVIGVLTSMGVPVSEANQNRIFIASMVIAVATQASDAVIRVGRAFMQGKALENADVGLDD